MKYKLIQKVNPLEPDSNRKWYSSPVKTGTINNYQVSKGIAAKSSMTRGAVLNVIENMVDEIPKYLMDGYRVNLNNLGTLRISMSSEGVNTPEDFTDDNIKNMRVVFTPSPEFKKSLKNIKYEQSE